MPSELVLKGGDWSAALVPETGGALAYLDFKGEPALRRARGREILDMASFALVPFSNRIAGSRFTVGERAVALTPNHPLGGNDPVLHGFGWLRAWHIDAATENSARLSFRYPGGEWPWPFCAWQTLTLAKTATLTLGIENRGSEPMPAGLGFHPYFPRDELTVLTARHRGEWQIDANTLPTRLIERSQARDWWDGHPVASRIVDTAYIGREGPLRIEWPSSGLRVTLEPGDDLDTTVIYVPESENYFCAEPVSHASDAINRAEGMRMLDPGESWEVSLTIRAERTL